MTSLHLRIASYVMACVIAWGANARARAPEEAAAVQPAAPPHIVLEPASTDANVAGVVLSCEDGKGDPVLQLQVYTRNGRRLLPDRRAGARPKADPVAFVTLDGRRFETSLLFADVYALLSDRSGPAPGLTREFVAALQDARTMVLKFDLLEEAAGMQARFDSETIIRLDARARAGIKAVARCTKSEASM